MTAVVVGNPKRRDGPAWRSSPELGAVFQRVTLGAALPASVQIKTMKNYLIGLIVALAAGPQLLAADEWWAVINLKGVSATSDQGYKFSPDGLKSLLICFSEEGGSVTGTDMKLTKFGKSTLVGVSIDSRGMETLEVYQIDREKMKLLYTKSRIRTNTVAPLLPDMVIALIGDAKPVHK